MICPFSRGTGQAGSSCKESCALWREVAKGLGECAFQTIADSLLRMANPVRRGDFQDGEHDDEKGEP